MNDRPSWAMYVDEEEEQEEAQPQPYVSEEDEQINEEFAPKPQREDQPLFLSDDGTQAFSFGSADEIEYVDEYLEKNKAFLRTESPIFSSIYAGARRAKFKLSGLFEPKESSDFDLETALDADDVPVLQRGLYEGVETEREYKYRKEGIEQELADRELIDSARCGELLGAYITEFMAFGQLGKAAQAVGKGVKIAKGLTLTEGVANIVNKIPTRVLKEAVKASGFATVLASGEYASSYLMSPEEAFAHGALYAVAGTALNLGGEKLAKVFGDWSTRLSDPNAEATIEEEIAKGIVGEKLVEMLSTKGLTKTHPYQMLYGSNAESKLAKRLFRFNEKVVEGADYLAMENRVDVRVEKLNILMSKVGLDLRTINKDIKRATGKSSREWFGIAYYSGESLIPVELPHRERLLSAVKKFHELGDKFRTERQEVCSQVFDMRKSFLPATEAGTNFSLEKLVERHLSGSAGDRPKYLPRTWDSKAVVEKKDELMKLLKQGLINQKAAELNEQGRLTLQALENYEASEALAKLADMQYLSLSSQGFGDMGPQELVRRTVRVDDSALYQFFSKDVFEEFGSWARSEISELEFERTLRASGYQTWNGFKETVRSEYDAAILKCTNRKEELALQESKSQAMERLHNMETLVKCRYLPADKVSPTAAHVLTGMRNLMYAGLLGATALNSLSDIKGLVAAFGLKKAFGSMARSLSSSIGNGLRELAGKHPTEYRELLNSLCLGTEEMKLKSMLKITPLQNEKLFYGCHNRPLSEKFEYWTGKAADKVMIVSGMNSLEAVYRRAAGELVLNQLRKDPSVVGLTKEALEDMIRRRKFSFKVDAYVLKQVNQLMNKPGLAEVPAFAYGKIGRFFYDLQSWSAANLNNFLYPFLKGSQSKRKFAEALFALVSMEMVSVYSRNLLRGNAFDLSKTADLERFQNQVLNRSLEGAVGSLSIYFNSILGAIDSAKTGRVDLFQKEMSPLVSYYSGVSKGVWKMIENTITGQNKINYWTARNALRIVPGNNIWYLEGMTNELAKSISGQDPHSKRRKK